MSQFVFFNGNKNNFIYLCQNVINTGLTTEHEQSSRPAQQRSHQIQNKTSIWSDVAHAAHVAASAITSGFRLSVSLYQVSPAVRHTS